MGRQSSIKKLPESVLAKLQAFLRDPQITQAEATRRTNDILERLGVGARVSAGSVNRYSQKMEQVGERLRQSREVAEMWIARLGSQPGGEVGHLINEMIRTMVFELMLKLQQKEFDAEDAPELAKMIKNLAHGVERLEKAASENEKRSAEIRKQATEEAAEIAAASAAQNGLSKERAAQIKADILGIAI